MFGEEVSMEDRPADAILEVLASAPEPWGARQVRQALIATQAGLELSEATVARRLRLLDRRGLTVAAGTKGRMITPAGRQHVAFVLRGRATAKRLLEGTEVRTSDGLIQLLRARRAVEPEAAREAALAGDDRLGSVLAEIIAEHRRHYASTDDVPRDISLRFHRRVAARTGNPLVRAMLDVVLDPALDRLEAALDVVLASHRTGAAAVTEHQAIADAITAGDAARAEETMRAHLDRLLEEAARFLTEETTPIVERLLTWGLSSAGGPPSTTGASQGRRADADH